MVEGALLLAEAVAAGWVVEAEFAPAGTPRATDAPRFDLAAGVLERVASTQTPQAVLGIVAIPHGGCELARASFVVVADAVADPGNVGTILRSAEAAGADAVALTVGSVDPYNPKTVRASAGALFHVPVVLVDSIADVRTAGLRVIGTSSHHGTSYADVDWSGRVAVVVGNEAHGIAPDAGVDEWVTIRHRGRAESLNVAMAATVLCFEIARRRG